MSAPTWEAAATLVRRDAAKRLARETLDEAAGALRVGVSTLRGWRTDGWLASPPRDVDHERAEVEVSVGRGENPLRRPKHVPAGPPTTGLPASATKARRRL